MNYFTELISGYLAGKKPSAKIKAIVCDDHFRHISERERAAALFKSSVQFIEIEIHSYCNRTCDFCGNSFLDRRNHKTLMEAALYSKIMDDLASIDYRGVISYSRYNEPTSDRPLFIERLREARAKLPQARLQTNTNGDYLTAEYIEAMRDAGLNQLFIMAYLPKGKKPTVLNFFLLMLSRLSKLGLPWKFRYLIAINHVEVKVPGIRVTYMFRNFLKTGTNRGGSLSTGNIIDRKSPCTIPMTDVYVDFNGSMVPCCEIRSDYEAHRGCVVYRLTPQNSIFDGYANSKLVLWRRDLTNFGPKKFPCNACPRGTYPATREIQDMFRDISKTADAVPVST